MSETMADGRRSDEMTRVWTTNENDKVTAAVVRRAPQQLRPVPVRSTHVSRTTHRRYLRESSRGCHRRATVRACFRSCVPLMAQRSPLSNGSLPIVPDEWVVKGTDNCTQIGTGIVKADACRERCGRDECVDSNPALRRVVYINIDRSKKFYFFLLFLI